jgi:hypothetical protein
VLAVPSRDSNSFVVKGQNASKKLCALSCQKRSICRRRNNRVRRIAAQFASDGKFNTALSQKFGSPSLNYAMRPTFLNILIELFRLVSLNYLGYFGRLRQIAHPFPNKKQWFSACLEARARTEGKKKLQLFARLSSLERLRQIFFHATTTKTVAFGLPACRKTHSDGT